MLEIVLTNEVVAFDGRVLELFRSEGERIHVRLLKKVVVKSGRKPRMELYWGSKVVFVQFDEAVRPQIDQLLAALNGARPGEIEFKY